MFCLGSRRTKETSSESETHLREIARDELDTLISELIAQLPARWRAALVLRYIRKLPKSEAATMMNIPASKVDRQVTRALNRLRAEIRRRGILCPVDLNQVPRTDRQLTLAAAVHVDTETTDSRASAT
jgi:hypothetical protein